MVLSNQTFLHLSQHLADTSNRDESLVCANKLTGCERVSLDELINLDAYLEHLHQNQPDRLNEEWVESILASAAFLGEVIRKASPRQYQWMEYDSVIALGTEYADFLGARELAVHAVLISLRGTVILPIYRVVMRILEGKRHSVHQFAKDEIAAAVEDRVPSPVIQAMLEVDEPSNSEWEVIEEFAPHSTEFNLTEVGFRLLDAGQDADAQANFAQQIEINPNDARAHKGLGDCHFFAGDFPAALSNYDHAIRLGADDWETLLARASARAELEQFTEALDDLNSAATHDGAVFEVTMERASVLLRMERIDEAISVYSALLDRDQMDDGERIQVLNARGNAYYEHDQLDNALSDLDSAEQIGSHDVDAFITMARIHELKGDLGLSISSYERAVECDEDNADGKNGLAWILATASDSTLQDGPRSELLACEALELAEPGDKHIVLDTLAAAHARQGNFNEAIAQQHKALELVDDNELKIDYKTRLELYSNQRTYEC